MASLDAQPIVNQSETAPCRTSVTSPQAAQPTRILDLPAKVQALQGLAGNQACARLLQSCSRVAVQRAVGAEVLVQLFQRGHGARDNGRLVRDTVARLSPGPGTVVLRAGTYVEVLTAGTPELTVRAWTPSRRGTLCVIPATSYAPEPQLADRPLTSQSPDRSVVGYRPSSGPLFGPSGGPEMADVHQGTLGDCYLLAATIAVLQSNPRYIRSLFSPTPVMVPGGGRAFDVALRVAIRKDNHAAEYMFSSRLVSDEFPHLQAGANLTPAYSGLQAPARSPIWPMLLEKRYAMREGGYDDLENGDTARAIEALTGRPAVKDSDQELANDVRTLRIPATQDVVNPLRAESGPSLVTRIARYLAARRPVVLGTPSTYTDTRLQAQARRLRVHTNHGYPVVSAVSQITLRNPWGNQHPLRPLTGGEVKDLFTTISVGASLTGASSAPPNLRMADPRDYW